MKINFWFGHQYAKSTVFAFDNGMNIVHTEYGWYVCFFTDENRFIRIDGEAAMALIKVLMAH